MKDKTNVEIGLGTGAVIFAIDFFTGGVGTITLLGKAIAPSVTVGALYLGKKYSNLIKKDPSQF